jgi:hypothetical protein
VDLTPPLTVGHPDKRGGVLRLKAAAVPVTPTSMAASLAAAAAAENGAASGGGATLGGGSSGGVGLKVTLEPYRVQGPEPFAGPYYQRHCYQRYEHPDTVDTSDPHAITWCDTSKLPSVFETRDSLYYCRTVFLQTPFYKALYFLPVHECNIVICNFVTRMWLHR